MADSSFVDDQQLRQELSVFDVTVGKITDKNRDILIKKLNHLRARQRATEAPPSPGRSPGRQSPGRAKKSTPRRSRVPESPHFPSSDEDDSGPGAAENVTRREINLRRRTVDSGLMNGERTDDTGTPGNTRGVTAFIEPVPEPGRRKRRSLGAAADSPFLAGSLRNPVLPQSSSPNRPRLRSGRGNDSTYDAEFSGSDDEYTFTEVATAAVNTSPSLRNVADTSVSSYGSLRSRQGKSKLQTGVYERDAEFGQDRCSRLWHRISRCLIYTVLVFFAIIVTYYIVMRTGRPALMPSSVDSVAQCEEGMREDSCVKKDELENLRELLLDIAEILNRRAGEHECSSTSLTRDMTKDDLKKVLQLQYGKANSANFEKSLKMIHKNPQWGIRLLDTSHEPTGDTAYVRFLESVSADKSLWCRLNLSFKFVMNRILLFIAVTAGLIIMLLLPWYVWRKRKMERCEVHRLVEDIISLLQNHATSCRSDPTLSPYLAVPHVRDALIPLAERKRKQQLWVAAVKYLSMNESRVREEVKTINGEECNVWRWIDTFPDPALLTTVRSQRSDVASSKCSSACLRVCNMLDPSKLYDEEQLSSAVLQRCGSHAGIMHIGITPDTPDSVYVKFVSETAAGQGCRALHGWTCDGRLTSVQEIRPVMYKAMFPMSVNAFVPLRDHSSRPT